MYKYVETINKVTKATKITILELNTNFEWNNKIRATLQNRILSRKQKLNKSKQKSNNGEDVYTLFQSI